MKGPTSTPTADDKARNAFERDLAGTEARTHAEGRIENLRLEGGIFVEAVRATRMAMCVTDPTLPGNPIVFANQSFVKLSGYGMDEILGQQPYFMNGPGTDPDDVARFEEALRNDQDDLVETIQYRKDGTRFIASVLLSAFKDEAGNTVHHFLSWLDVTRRTNAENRLALLQRAQEGLRSSEAKYRGLFNSIDEGFCVIEMLFDPGGQPADYVFLEVNPAFERQTGLTDAVGKRMRDLAPEHEQHWFDIYGRVAVTGEPQRFEQPAEALGRWYEVYAFRIGEPDQRHVAILFNDIAKRKRAEEKLREGEDRQAFLLKLSDALRPISDAHEIQVTTARMVGEHLGADRAMYGEVEGDFGRERGTVRGQYVRETGGNDPTVPFPEHFTFGQFGQHTMAARYRGEPLIVADVQTDPAYSAEERAAWAQFGVRAAVVATLPKGGRLVAEFGVHSATAREWTEAEIALIQEVAERTWASAERARAETALRASEHKYRSLFESMDEAYAVVDVLKDEAGNWADFRFVEVNPAFIHHTGMPYPVGKTATELLGTPNPRWAKLYGEALDTGKPLRVEEPEATLGLTFDLNIFTLDPAHNRVAVLFTNITERKRAEEALRDSERRARTLLAELQHRVRNVLAMMRSLVRRASLNKTDVTDFVDHLQGRIDAMARTQSALTRAPGRGVDLESMIFDELLAFAAREGAFTLRGPQVLLPPKAAEVLTLAVHELAVNSMKYGAIGGDGTAALSWAVEPRGGEQWLRLSWKETGVEIENLNPKPGFGTELITQRVPYELGGSSTMIFRRDGMQAAMEFPLRDEGSVLQSDEGAASNGATS